MVSKIGSKIFKVFDGSGDVSAWLKKLELVAKLQKVTCSKFSPTVFWKRILWPYT